MYSGLEKRVQDELAYDVNRYLIRTGVIERQYFDASHHLMSPMDDADLHKSIHVVLSELPEGINLIREYGTQHAYLAEDNMEIRSISQGKEKLLIISSISKAKKWGICIYFLLSDEY